MTDYPATIADYNQCIEIRERFVEEVNLFDESDLATVYLNRGVAYYSMTDYSTAIADFNRCIEMRKRLFEQGKLSDENDLAKAYMNRGGSCPTQLNTLYHNSIQTLKY